MIRRNFIKKTAIAGTAIYSGLLGAYGSNIFGFNDPTIHTSDFSGKIIRNKHGHKVFILKPDELDEILANPGIGWETQGRVAKQDKNLPSWIPSTICYCRWGWDKFEPKQGQIDTDFIGGYLKEAHDSGQKLALRVMPIYPGRKTYPDWLKEIGGRINYYPHADGVGDTPIIDFDDPIVLEAHTEFIEKLGILYDGNPDLDHVDIGSVGCWGEWNLSGFKDAKMPSIENLKKIIDAYIYAFRKTPLVIPIASNRPHLLQYATGHGAGWRADCFGDMNWHMMKYYTQALAGDNALEAWKKGPVAWESCWEAKKWVSEGWSLRFIFNYGLALHGSVLNNKSATLPEGEEAKAEIIRFLKRLGYRFVLKEIRVPEAVKVGNQLELNMKWQNTGSAPCYRPYRLAYRLTDISEKELQGTVVVSSVNVKNWMPGDMVLNPEEYLKNPVDLPLGEINEVKESINLPGDIKPGKYKLAIAIIGEKSDNVNAGKPLVRLGIKGRSDDGWYPLCEITITR
ncbi:MAG: DUF4832 domain-containing protein [Prolixibacteraceae bacterium]|jgi:hypothetical protein|nr:DUF4832 domain-containing protein [Prolixibacteraceae bacterium]